MCWERLRRKLYEWTNKMEKLVQITSGRGPAECNMAVRKVADRMIREAQIHSIRIEQHAVESIANLPCSITLKLNGKNVDPFLKQWLGTIQWICKSPVRPFHKRKNWFVAVVEIAQATLVSPIDERDVTYQSMRSAGPGGQNVNKVSTGIRATHTPTGLTVQVMDSRSQLQNKQLSLERLREKVAKMNAVSSMQLQTNAWLSQINIARGNPKRVFSGLDFKES